MPANYLIIGSGFSGAVLASQLTRTLPCQVEIWEERSHIGGNCYTERDPETGIMVHKYGPHIFNTDRKDIWDFVNSLVTLRPYVHRVKAMSGGKIYSLPVNLATINALFEKTLAPAEAKAFLDTLADHSIQEPANFEEQALKFIGSKLYYAFFHGYTKKQWGCDPKDLPSSLLKRIPVRFNYDDNYHNNIFTGIPVDGYTAIFEKLLAHPRIHLTLNKKFDSSFMPEGYDHIFYTGPLDAFFKNQYGRLGYRTVSFESFVADGDYQGTAQMNFCDEEVPFTRVTEHKHFTPWELHSKTIVFREYSKETSTSDIPYYPKRLATDKALFLKYRAMASHQKCVSFLGRLATYRYMDMHHVIGEALDFAKAFLDSVNNLSSPPVFPNEEN